jgi:hypothetical protein
MEKIYPNDFTKYYSYNNFNDFGNGMVLLFELLMVNNWINNVIFYIFLELFLI